MSSRGRNIFEELSEKHLSNRRDPELGMLLEKAARHFAIGTTYENRDEADMARYSYEVAEQALERYEAISRLDKGLDNGS